MTQFYHDINCMTCGEKFSSDKIGFDFLTIINQWVQQLPEDSMWKIISKFNWKFYLTPEEIFKVFNFRGRLDCFSNFNMKVWHLKWQLEKLLQLDMDEILDLANSEDLSSIGLMDQIYQELKTTEDEEQFIKDFLMLLEALNDDDIDQMVIFQVPMHFNLGHDQSKQTYLIHSLEYRFGEKEYKLDRICPYCGTKLEEQAGLYEERIVGMLGQPGCGKREYLNAIIDALKNNGQDEVLSLSSNQGNSFDLYNLHREEETSNLYLTIHINQKTYNYLFVHMLDVDIEATMNPLIYNANFYWYFIDGKIFDLNEMVHFNKMISNLDLKDKTAVICTNSHLHPDLYRENSQVLLEYIADGTVDDDRYESYQNLTLAYFSEHIHSFRQNCDFFFQNYSVFAISSYGENIKNKSPSMIELPILWLGGMNGDLKLTKFKRGFLGISEREELSREKWYANTEL